MAYIFIIVWVALLGNVADAEYGPGVVKPVECVGVACQAEHGNGFVGGSGEFDRPDVPDVPDKPDKPKGDKDKGHGNDDDRDDEDNPGKGKHKGRN